MRTRLFVLLSRIRAMFAGGRLDADFDQEVASHLAMATEENIRRGMTPGEARRAAIVRFGGPTQIKRAAAQPSVAAICRHAPSGRAQRVREIGVRMALGATAWNVVRTMLADGLRPVVAGAVGRLLLALGVSTVVRAMLIAPS